MLAVAFHYPPDHTSTGVLRTLKFTQYLVKHGWQSDVISVPESLYVSTDPAFNHQVPQGTRVFRTWAVDVKELLGVRGIYPDFAAIPAAIGPVVLLSCAGAPFSAEMMRTVQAKRPDLARQVAAALLSLPRISPSAALKPRKRWRKLLAEDGIRALWKELALAVEYRANGMFRQLEAKFDAWRDALAVESKIFAGCIRCRCTRRAT